MKNELLFQQLWAKYGLSLKELRTTEGEQVLIFNTGTLNTDQGADFKNAHIKIGNAEWYGNVELHLRTSDWFRHGHDTDREYRNVILHVVWKHDLLNFNSCPVLELGKYLNDLSELKFDEVSQTGLACAELGKRSIAIHKSWVHKWLMTRMQSKVNHFLKLVELSKGDIEQVAWMSLARCFGYKINADCFEELARSLPIKVLRYHTGDLLSIEALLLGQSGLLPENPKDDHIKSLSEHYQHLKWKYDLFPIHLSPAFLRMRPSNFPTIRLAQLASLVSSHHNIIDKLLSFRTLEELHAYFTIEVSPYWIDHYLPDKASCSMPKKIGLGLINTIIINMIIPIQMLMKIRKGKKGSSIEELSILELLPPDQCRLLYEFKHAGIKAENAFQSQALLELYSQKCRVRECAGCSFLIKQ